jgi:hypothetical protein
MSDLMQYIIPANVINMPSLSLSLFPFLAVFKLSTPYIGGERKRDIYMNNY